jgi:prolyl-tRNA editing enzyme YbaK/EbsC (Cys-tRNA(Pro) deacylase)
MARLFGLRGGRDGLKRGAELKMSLKPSVERVRQTLRSTGLTVKVTEFSESTRTAAEAIGTTVGQIAKSLVFMVGDEPVLVLASGANRVDVEKMNRLLGKKIINPDAETVKNVTGFSMGGVPPVAHSKRLRSSTSREDRSPVRFEYFPGTIHVP